MSGVIYSLSCPIGAIGGECFWTITCLDGTKQTIVLLEGEIFNNGLWLMPTLKRK